MREADGVGPGVLCTAVQGILVQDQADLPRGGILLVVRQVHVDVDVAAVAGAVHGREIGPGRAAPAAGAGVGQVAAGIAGKRGAVKRIAHAIERWRRLRGCRCCRRVGRQRGVGRRGGQRWRGRWPRRGRGRRRRHGWRLRRGRRCGRRRVESDLQDGAPARADRRHQVAASDRVRRIAVQQIEQHRAIGQIGCDRYGCGLAAGAVVEDNNELFAGIPTDVAVEIAGIADQQRLQVTTAQRRMGVADADQFLEVIVHVGVGATALIRPGIGATIVRIAAAGQGHFVAVVDRWRAGQGHLQDDRQLELGLVQVEQAEQARGVMAADEVHHGVERRACEACAEVLVGAVETAGRVAVGIAARHVTETVVHHRIELVLVEVSLIQAPIAAASHLAHHQVIHVAVDRTAGVGALDVGSHLAEKAVRDVLGHVVAPTDCSLLEPELRHRLAGRALRAAALEEELAHTGVVVNQLGDGLVPVPALPAPAPRAWVGARGAGAAGREPAAIGGRAGLARTLLGRPGVGLVTRVALQVDAVHASVVEDRVQNDAQAVGRRGGHQGVELGIVAVARVDVVVVVGIVAVIRRGVENRVQIKCVHAQIIEIPGVDLVNDPLQVAAKEVYAITRRDGQIEPAGVK